MASPLAKGASYTWQIASGDWSAASNWGGTLPTKNDYAYIANGGTANVTELGASCGTISLGSSTGRGTVQMTAGNLPVTGYVFVGNSGLGSFSQSAGSQSSIYLLCLGNAAVGNGTYNLNGGLISALNVDVGANGIGNFTQSGGTDNVETFFVGANAGGSGTYNLSGSGILSVRSDAFVGYHGSGTFTQSGGTNSVLKSPRQLGGGFRKCRNVDLNHGLLLVPGIGGGLGTSTLNLNGGTLKASGNSSAWVIGLTTAYVQAGGAIIDVQRFSDTIGQNLLHDSTLGATPTTGLPRSVRAPSR